MSDHSNEGWIPWKGGECPVEPEAVVRLRTRSGYETRSDLRAGEKHLQKFWQHEHSKRAGYGEYDIIAYRVIKQ